MDMYLNEYVEISILAKHHIYIQIFFQLHESFIVISIFG